MSTQNNVHVSDELLDAMSRAAQSRGKDVHGLFEEAAQRLLAHQGLDDLVPLGSKYAGALKPSDAVRLVRESRDEQRGQ